MTNKDTKDKKLRTAVRMYDDADDTNDNKVSKSSGYDYSADASDTGADTKDVQKAIHALQKLATNEQEVITKLTSEYMTIVKFTLAQARKVWTAAAAWSSGVHKESVDYVNAVAESAAEQFYSNMEAVC